jgi:hypothetical protein
VAVKLTDAQAVVVPLMDTTGKGLTVTTWDVLAEQPCAEVTVTVYVPLARKVFAAVVLVLPPDHS